MRGSVVKRGRTWSYVLDVGRDAATGRRRQRWKGGFATKGDAEHALAARLAGVDGAPADEAGAMSLAAYLDEWLAGVRPALKPSTAKSYTEIIRWYVNPRVGAVALADLNAFHLRGLYADLLECGSVRTGGPLAPATVRAVHRVLRKACNDALHAGLIARSPMTGVRPPRQSTPEMQTWTADEVRRLLTATLHDRLYALWVLELATGMRRGELAGLRWADVDLEAGRLAVRRSRVSVGYRVHEGERRCAGREQADRVRGTKYLSDRVAKLLVVSHTIKPVRGTGGTERRWFQVVNATPRRVLRMVTSIRGSVEDGC